MSASVRTQADDRNIELGSAVNWPPIVAAAGLGLVVLIAVVVLGLAAAAAPKTESVTTQQTVVPTPEQDALLPPPLPWPQPRETQPQPAVVVAISKPALSQRRKAYSKPAVVVSTPVPQPVVEDMLESTKPTQVVQTNPVQVLKRYSPDGVAPVATNSVAGWDVQSFKRYSTLSEAELRERLYREVPELDVETEKGTTAKLLAEVVKATNPQSADKDADKPQAKTPPILELIAKRAELKGLPVRELNKCQVPATETEVLSQISRTIRIEIARSNIKRDTKSSSLDQLERDRLMATYLESRFARKEWREDAGMRMMVQMFQIENEVVREKMIKVLAANKGKSTSVALAQLAVFDFNPEVRLWAIAALKDRPRVEVRPVLVEALRYPWAPVAEHAAEAIVALNYSDAVGELVSMLDKPDPQAPIQNKDKKWVVAELVRVNHLGNCVLCHAPCSEAENIVRGVVPVRGQPLPRAYYESKEGPFVRADVTYLKQDFSIMQYVEKPGAWPNVQRFDYLIRQRELSADEVKRLAQAEKNETETPIYPQREAVLWTLRELTGKDIGAKSEDWNRYIESMKTERMKCDP